MPIQNIRSASGAGAIVIFSASLQFYRPEYPVVAFGFVMALILTFFNGKAYTIIIGTVSSLLIIGVAVSHREQTATVSLFNRHLLSLVIIVATTILTLIIKRQNQNMSRDRKYYTNVFENATEGIILSDDKAKMYLINPAAQQMFGYKEKEMLGHSIDLLIPSRYHQNHHHHQADFYKYPEVKRMGAGRDLCAQRKDGSEFPVEVSLSYFKDGSKTFVIAFVMDITLRKFAEVELIKANTDLIQLNADTNLLNEELEGKVNERTLMLQEALHQVETTLEKEKELSEIKSRFVSMASHEFRTPLSTVLFSASLLGKYVTAEDQDKRTRHVLKIKESVRHLNNILEDFLSLGKLNEGHIKPIFQEFFVKELIADVIEEMKDLLKPGQYIALTYTDLPVLYSDSRLLKNSIINLLSNAVKYSPEHSRIQIDTAYINNNLEISMLDNGIGIPAEDIPHLFTSFFRGKNAMNIKGTGLGLQIVKRYMDLLGGAINLESILDQGTKVTIIIPNQQNTRNHE